MMQLFDGRLMRLLTFLTRTQAWLSPSEVVKRFRIGDEKVAYRTVHRWFSFLRENGGLVYFPYPKANRLGLQDVLVRAYGLRSADVLSIVPFGASFNVEVNLGDTVPFVSQTYWVPGDAVMPFREYWRTAEDLGLVSAVDILLSRNTHFAFSPFDEAIAETGRAEILRKPDNRYFEALIKRNLGKPFAVGLAERIAESPLIIPIVIEHIWEHYSSRHVWQAIRSRGEADILAYGKKFFATATQRPGSALRILQQQWQDLVEDFNDVFLQPRVLFDWTQLKGSVFLSFLARTRSSEDSVKLAVRSSEVSIYAALKLGVETEGACHVSCFLPTDQLLPILRLVREHHIDREPPSVAVQDKEATIALFQPSFCKLDWRMFDPANLSWRFAGDAYVERLKGIRSSQSLEGPELLAPRHG